MKKYYQLETDGTDADLYIFGDITSYPWGEKDKDAYGIIKELGSLTASNIRVHINSYGGDVSEGLAIYNTLKNSNMNITTVCDGFACSAASVIFMAGKQRIMNAASLLMVHNAWTYGAGNATELRKMADDIEKITQASVEAYKSVAQISEKEITKLMDDESWISPDEALEYGFATEIAGKSETAPQQSAFGSIMQKLLQKKIAPAQSIKEIEADELAEKIAEKLEARKKKDNADGEPDTGEKSKEPKKKATEAEKQTGFNSLY